MPSPAIPRRANLTLRLDADTILWARARAMFGGTSVNKLIREFLDEYAAIPHRWRDGLPPPWTPEDRIRPVMDPVGAGLRAAAQYAPELDPVAELGALDGAEQPPIEAFPQAPRSRRG